MTTPTLVDSVAGALRDLLITGHTMCGERLVEIALAHEMNVSQNTVRDALHVLESEGWVVRHARRGVFVRAFTPEDADEVYALLAAVESVALEWALDKMTKARAADLRRLLLQARRAAMTGDPFGGLGALFAFHEGLVATAEKPLTGDLLRRLMNYARLLEALRQTRVPYTLEDFDALISAHDTLLKRIEDGERGEAQELLMAVINRYRDAVLPALAI